ncbi:MAG: ATP-binding protein [Saprospiraceae bacterium]|nr:ATP-binding protein [Saprospiraceae bacterium]
MSSHPLRIVLTGPESSGKTTLAALLAERLQTVWVPEFARFYLSALGRPYELSDLSRIAYGQAAREEALSYQARRWLFCDTGPLELKVWAEVRYDLCPPVIEGYWQARRHDLFLLCSPDIPWEFDPLRENPDDRTALYRLYRQILSDSGRPFVELKGTVEERLGQALQVLSAHQPH